MSDVIVVEACGLQPPEPMERVIAALEILGAGQRVRLHIDRQPVGLYRMLQANAYRWSSSTRSDGTYDVEIWEV